MKEFIPPGNIRHIMSAPCVYVQQGQPPSEVRRMLYNDPHRRIHHIPIVDGERLVGIVSATDFLKVMYPNSNNLDAWIDWEDTELDRRYSTPGKHSTIMDMLPTRTITTISVDDTINQAAQKLATGDFHSLPVVDGSNNLVGIVTSTDLIKYLATVKK